MDERNVVPGTGSFRGAVAIVTGGGSGIGRATAKLFAAEGLTVALVGRTGAKLEAVAAEIEAAGGAAWGIQADLAQPEAADRIIEDVAARTGRLDVIVNNAAAIKVGAMESFSVQEFDNHICTNLRSPFFLITRAIPLLRESPSAAVVNVSSTVGSPLVKQGHVVYGMTKAALEYFSHAAAYELAAYGIRVNCLAPGSVATPIHFEWAPDMDYAKEHLRKRIPLGRMGEPEEIALWIWQLVRPETAWCTGATLNVDGGQALGLPEDFPT
jgi:meso-butanediol dehydrogenase / (S,S)-butanediol dehydrogenase / diacetyl reductase